MRHAILIHAHRFPEQFGRLCHTVEHPDFDVYANIDAKSDMEPFRAAAPQVSFINKRIDVGWAKWSQVKATLNSLAEIMASGKEYGYIIFISGQDYPVKSLTEIARILDEGKGAEYIRHDIHPDPAQEKKFVERYTLRTLNPCSKILRRAFKNIATILPRRKAPFPVFHGPQWWTLSTSAVSYILDFCRDNPKAVAAYRNTWCPDEMFFQMIMFSSPFRNKITDDIKRYIDWSAGAANPRNLTAADYPAIVGSGSWFARKIDAQADEGLMEMLDKHRETT